MHHPKNTDKDIPNLNLKTDLQVHIDTELVSKTYITLNRLKTDDIERYIRFNFVATVHDALEYNA